MFKKNQEVIIKGLYNFTTDGAGRFIKELEYGEYKGRYMIEIATDIVAIEPERVIDANEYWTQKKKEREEAWDKS